MHADYPATNGAHYGGILERYCTHGGVWFMETWLRRRGGYNFMKSCEHSLLRTRPRVLSQFHV